MTRRTNARVAGSAFLIYIAVSLPAMVLSGRAMAGEGIAAKLVSMAEHAVDVRVAAVLDLLGAFSAVVLAVTLYSLTRDQDRDIATLGMTCRLAEGITGGLSVHRSLSLLWLATAADAKTMNSEAAHAIGTFVLKSEPWGLGALFFAVGSTCFAWLLLRGRMIPAALGWLGVLASILLVLVLPLQITGAVNGVIPQLIWIPMAVFELALAVLLLTKGVPMPVRSSS